MEDIRKRALAAYVAKVCDIKDGKLNLEATVVRVDGREYVAIKDSGELSAVYRVKVDGLLRLMKRPPKEIEGA